MKDAKSDAGGGDAIRIPLQARSRETMDRIMESLEELLREKPFDKITMIELAQRSQTGTSSIYARFKDKSSLVLGMHMRLRESALACLAKLTDPTRWQNKPIDEIAATVIQQAMKFYDKHAPLIRAAIYVNDENVRERQASVLRTAAQQFSELVVPRKPAAKREIEEAIDASCSIFAAVTYFNIMFEQSSPARQPVSQQKRANQLVTVITSLLDEAMNKDSNSKSAKKRVKT